MSVAVIHQYSGKIERTEWHVTGPDGVVVFDGHLVGYRDIVDEIVERVRLHGIKTEYRWHDLDGG